MYGKNVMLPCGESFWVNCTPTTSQDELYRLAWKKFEEKYID
jgi:hypothetical protein